MFIILRNVNKIQFYLLHWFLINIKSILILIRQSKPKSLVHVFPLRLNNSHKKETFLWLTRTFDSTVTRNKNKQYWFFIERQKDLNSISRTIKLKDLWYSVIDNYRAFPIIYYNDHCNQRSLGIITCHKSTIFLLHIDCFVTLISDILESIPKIVEVVKENCLIFLATILIALFFARKTLH